MSEPLQSPSRMLWVSVFLLFFALMAGVLLWGQYLLSDTGKAPPSSYEGVTAVLVRIAH